MLSSLTQDFELASYTRDGTIWDRQMLEEGPRPTQYEANGHSLFLLLCTARAWRRDTDIHAAKRGFHSAVCLIVSLVGVAGLYLLQKAEFLFDEQEEHHDAPMYRMICTANRNSAFCRR